MRWVSDARYWRVHREMSRSKKPSWRPGPVTLEAHGLPVDGVQCGDDPVGLVEDGRALGDGHIRYPGVAGDPPVGEAHDVEGGADDRLVLAEHVDLGAPGPPVSRRAAMTAYSRSIACADGSSAARRAWLGAQHPGPLARAQQPRRIGLAAGEPLRGELRPKPDSRPARQPRRAARSSPDAATRLRGPALARALRLQFVGCDRDSRLGVVLDAIVRRGGHGGVR